jgi:y4mF family transcriptional regulator
MLPIGRMMIGTPTELGIALKQRRRELSLTQDALAAAIGVNRRVVGELERGKGSVRIEIALAIAQALGLDVDLRPRT